MEHMMAISSLNGWSLARALEGMGEGTAALLGQMVALNLKGWVQSQWCMVSAGHQSYWLQSFNNLQYWCLNSYLGEGFLREQRLNSSEWTTVRTVSIMKNP